MKEIERLLQFKFYKKVFFSIKVQNILIINTFLKSMFEFIILN